MKFNLTRICPFLDKTCIGIDCPSFFCETHRRQNFIDYVLVVEKRGFLKKKHKRGWGLEVGSTIFFSPMCRVLSNKILPRYHGPVGVSVGESFEEVIKLDKPKWTRINWWTSDFIEVKDLPDVDAWLKTIPEKGSEFTTKDEEEK